MGSFQAYGGIYISYWQKISTVVFLGMIKSFNLFSWKKCLYLSLNNNTLSLLFSRKWYSMVSLTHGLNNCTSIFPLDNHHTFVWGRNSLCIVHVCNIESFKMCAQEIRFNKINNIYCSSRTFLGENGFLVFFKYMTVKNTVLFVQF